tara:strand:+ start:12068 stop:12541 length:474 start_codon:yes stop_codon:yes gene_type:complete
MWTIIKIDLKKLNTFNQDIKKKIGDDVRIYFPKVKISNRTLPLIGDYIFCFHNEFRNLSYINKLKFTKGLKYFLNGHIESQSQIEYFVNKCKSLENDKGLLSKNICELIPNSMYQFKTGLLKNEIFKLLEIQKNKIKILINDVKFKVNSNNFIISRN